METTRALATADGPMDAYVAAPDGAPRAGIVVVQEAFGVVPHIRDVARRFAAAGYLAIAPELFHRTGRGVEVPYGDPAQVMPHFGSLTNDAIATDVGAAVAELRRSCARVAVVGFCMGEFAALLSACRLPVDAAVAFYGGGVVAARPHLRLTPLLPELDRIRCPVLLLYGGADAGIPPEHVEATRARLAEVGARFELEVYPGAGHGFFCDDRPAFHPDAARAAWARTVAWLDATLPDAAP